MCVLFCRLKKCPSYILLENVSGFEVSETRSRLVQMLDKCHYAYQVKCTVYMCHTVKILEIGTSKIITIIYLKIEQFGFTMH